MTVEERWSWAKGKKVCFSCLERYNHQSGFCRKRKECGQSGCKRYHHRLLHECVKQQKKEGDTLQSKKEENKQPNVESNCSTNIIQNSNQVLLRIAPITLEGPTGKQLNTYALFDEASTVTLLDKEVAEQLEISGNVKPLCVQWTNDITKITEDSEVVSVQISAQCPNSKVFHLKNVRTVSDLQLPTQTVDMDEIIQKWPYLRNIPIKSMIDAKPVILIGQDNWSLTVPRSVIQRSWNEPVSTKTKLGWVLHGKVGDRQEHETDFVHFTVNSDLNNDKICELLRKTFEFDNIDDNFKTETDDITHAKEQLINSTRKVDERKWETGLLWKKDVSLPESKITALKRLQHVERQMEKDAGFKNAYVEKMQEYIDKSYARKLSEEEVDQPARLLPHFAVRNPNKKKIRIVFDCAAKSQNKSLNDNLLKGPDMYNNLISILWKFRHHKIAFTGDIKEMFLQIKISDEDQPTQRLFWRKNREDPVDTYEMSVMLFGAACSPCSAQYVRNLNAVEYATDYPEAVSGIQKYHFMNDYLYSVPSESEAAKLIKEVIFIHKEGGFKMCNWICNSKKVLMQIPEDLRSVEDKNLEFHAVLPQERVLGLHWDPNSDQFTFKAKFHKVKEEVMQGKRTPTKREILQVTMSVYDPLGFVANILIFIKILLQDLWINKLYWDEQITKNFAVKWEKWRKIILQIENLKIPRCFSTTLDSSSDVQLHVFCDASVKASCAVAYLRIKTPEEINVSFVMAKTKLGPTKQLSIPRMELNTALLASKLASYMENQICLKMLTLYYWTDSQTVFYWLKSDFKFQTIRSKYSKRNTRKNKRFKVEIDSDERKCS